MMSVMTMPGFASVRRWNRNRVLVLAMLLMTCLPLAGRAATDEEEVHPDARLEGYATQVALKEGSIATSVLVFILLTGITIGVMFINAKRSHLD